MESLLPSDDLIKWLQCLSVHTYIHIFCPILMKLGIWVDVHYLYVVINLSLIRLSDHVIFNVKLPNCHDIGWPTNLNTDYQSACISVWPHGAIFQLAYCLFLHEMPSKLAETAI